MANARMLHKKISISVQVNSLSEPARLLFTWMIPHTDVEGKLKGDPKFVKATVIPMFNWSLNKVKKCIEEIVIQGLLYYWQADNEWIIEFVNFARYQTVRKDHEKASYLPSFPNKNDSLLTDQRQPGDGRSVAKDNKSEVNSKEDNKSEDNDLLADKNSYKKEAKTITPELKNMKSPSQVAAYEVWKEFEPNNLRAFYTTYLLAAFKGVPAEVIYQFASEMRQDKTIKNPGAVFNKKVEDYLKNKKFGNSPDPLIDNPTKEVEDEVNEHED